MRTIRLFNFLRTDLVLLAAICLLGLVISLCFFQGINTFDELLYANSAQTLTQGEANLNLRAGGAGRIGHYGPLALLFAVFGPSVTATVAWPLTAFLATICLIYLIGKHFGGSKAGLLAALFWILLPVVSLNATKNVPDVPMAMLSAAIIYVWLKARFSEGRKKIVGYAITIILFVWGFWAKELILFTGVFLILWAGYIDLWPKLQAHTSKILKNYKFLLLGSFALSSLLLFAFGDIQRVSFPDILAVTSSDILGLLTGEPLFYFVLPTILVVIYLHIRFPQTGTTFLLAWLTFTFLAFEWAPISFDPLDYRPYPIRPAPDRSLLLILQPVALLTGLYLSRTATWLATRNIVWATFGVIGSSLVFWHLGWLPVDILLAVSSLCMLGLVAVSLGLINLSKLTENSQTLHLMAFFLCIGTAAMNPMLKSHEYSYPQFAEYQNLKTAVSKIAQYPDFSILFFSNENQRTLNYLNFLSEYKLAPDPFDEFSGRIDYIQNSGQVTENSLVIVIEQENLSRVSPTWWELATISQPSSTYLAEPPKLHIFRSLSHQRAISTLEDAREALAVEPGKLDLLRHLLAASVNANEPEIAFETYMELVALDHNAQHYEPRVIRLLEFNLGQLAASDNLLSNGEFGEGLNAWEDDEAVHAGDRLSFEEQGGQTLLRIEHVVPGETIPISQHVDLQPNTVYVFEMQVQNTGPIVPLYWWVNGDEQSYVDRLIPQEGLTHLQFVFITPDWETARNALVAPLVFQETGEVLIGSLSLRSLIETDEQ